MSATASGRYSIIPARAFDDTAMTLPLLRMLGILGTYGNRDGYCHPARKTLAKRAGISEGRVSQLTRQLRELGYIEVIHTHLRGGRQGVSTYKVLMDGLLPRERDRNPETLGVSSSLTPGVSSSLTPGVSSSLTPINVPLERSLAQGASSAAGEAEVTPASFSLDPQSKADRDTWASSQAGILYLLASARQWDQLSEASRWWHYRRWIMDTDDLEATQ